MSNVAALRLAHGGRPFHGSFRLASSEARTPRRQDVSLLRRLARGAGAREWRGQSANLPWDGLSRVLPGVRATAGHRDVERLTKAELVTMVRDAFDNLISVLVGQAMSIGKYLKTCTRRGQAKQDRTTLYADQVCELWRCSRRVARICGPARTRTHTVLRGNGRVSPIMSASSRKHSRKYDSEAHTLAI